MAQLIPTITAAFSGLAGGGAAAAGASPLGMFLSKAGLVAGAVGQVQAARTETAVADYNAKQVEAQASAERAAAAQRIKEEDRQGRLIMSRARAVAGASGGGQDIPLLSSIEEEATYRKYLAWWEGEERAAGREAQAAGLRFEGRQRATARRTDAVGGLLSGWGRSMLDNYGS
jgi:hypothetical protein